MAKEKKKSSSKETNDTFKGQYGFVGPLGNRYGYDPSISDYITLSDIVVYPENYDPRESITPEPLYKEDKNEKAKADDSKKDAVGMIEKESREAALEHGLEAKKEEDKPTVLVPKDKPKEVDKNPAKDLSEKGKEEKIAPEASPEEKKSDVAGKEKIKLEAPKEAEKEKGKEEQEQKEVPLLPEEEPAAEPEMPSFGEFMELVDSPMSDEEAMAKAMEARELLRAHADIQKESVLIESAATKEKLSAEKDAKITEIKTQQHQRTRQVRSTIGNAKKTIKSQADALRLSLKGKLEADIKKINENTSNKLKTLATEVKTRRDAFLKFVEDEKKRPHEIAGKEAARAVSELESAALECIKIGQEVAAQYPGNEDKRPKQREAAMGVANESAKDIRGKKEPVKQSILDRANEFGGNYDEYTEDVLKQLTDTETGLKDAFLKMEENSIAELRKINQAAMDNVDKEEKDKSDALQKMEKSSVSSLEKSAGDSVAKVKKEFKRVSKEIDTLQKALTDQIDQIGRDVDDQFNAGEDAVHLPGVIQLMQGASGNISTIVSDGKTQLETISSGCIELFTTLATKFGSHAQSIAGGATKSAKDMQADAKAQFKTIEETYDKDSKALIENTEKGQQTAMDESFKDIDKAIEDRKSRLQKISEKFKEELVPEVNDSITESKLPLTDPLRERCQKAAKKAGEPWWKGVISGIAKLIAVIVIIVIVAVVLVAIGIGSTVMGTILVIGAVLLAVAFIASFVTRLSQGYGVMASIGLGVSDALGTTAIYEAWTGKEVGTGRELTEFERGEKGAEGTLGLIMMFAGVRGKIPGIRRVKFPNVFKGVKNIIPKGLKKEGGAMGQLYNYIKSGGKSIGEYAGRLVKWAEARSVKVREARAEKYPNATKKYNEVTESISNKYNSAKKAVTDKVNKGIDFVKGKNKKPDDVTINENTTGNKGSDTKPVDETTTNKQSKETKPADETTNNKDVENTSKADETVNNKAKEETPTNNKEDVKDTPENNNQKDTPENQNKTEDTKDTDAPAKEEGVKDPEPIPDETPTHEKHPEEILDLALKKQGFKEGDAYPEGFKEKWSEGGYDYEVRIHPAEAQHGKTGGIYRVGRRKQGVNEQGQGYGWEYGDKNGNWHPTSTLKPGKGSNKNPSYNEQAAKDTHIEVPDKTIGKKTGPVEEPVKDPVTDQVNEPLKDPATESKDAVIKPEERPTAPKVIEDGFGGYKATWKGDNKAFSMFKPEENGVHVSDLFRGNQPKGTAGIMLADSLKAAGFEKPSNIRFTNILETQPTIKQLADGVPIEETVLGKTLQNTVKELGGTVKKWTSGEYRGKQWIEAVIEYGEPKPKLPGNTLKDSPVEVPLENSSKKTVLPDEVKNSDPKGTDITNTGKDPRPLESMADPVKDVLGPGRESHPAEWQAMIDEMEKAGVEIRFTEPGNEQLAYAPGLREGEPGQLVLDPDASISALKHEYQHFLDDQAIGFGGMKTLFDAPLRYAWEFKAYMQEIRMMRQQRRFDVARLLLENLRKEKLKIETEIGPVKPETEPTGTGNLTGDGTENKVTGISANTGPHEIVQANEVVDILGGGEIHLVNSKQGIEGVHVGSSGTETPVSLKKFSSSSIKNVFRKIRDNGSLIADEATRDPKISIGDNPNSVLYAEVDFTEAQVLDFIADNKSNVLPQGNIFRSVIFKTSDGKIVHIPTNN